MLVVSSSQPPLASLCAGMLEAATLGTWFRPCYWPVLQTPTIIQNIRPPPFFSSPFLLYFTARIRRSWYPDPCEPILHQAARVHAVCLNSPAPFILPLLLAACVSDCVTGGARGGVTRPVFSHGDICPLSHSWRMRRSSCLWIIAGPSRAEGAVAMPFRFHTMRPCNRSHRKCGRCRRRPSARSAPIPSRCPLALPWSPFLCVPLFVAPYSLAWRARRSARYPTLFRPRVAV